MLETLGDLLTLVGFFFAGLFLWLALSPFETLGWWAGWFGDTIYEDARLAEASAPADRSSPDAYVLFLSGVGRTSSETVAYRERDFLQRLRRKQPRSVIIDDIFPYATNNLSLTAKPFIAPLWRLSLWSKVRGVTLPGYLINMRNIAQVLISADRRYGPLFNQGVAEVLMQALLRHGYVLEQKTPVFLIGFSGAGQIAVGASLYLKEWLKAPIFVISLGGIFGSDPALLFIDHLYHLVGTNDTVERARLLAPGRWSIFATSIWNRVVRQGKVTHINMGPMAHLGPGSYLDAKSELPDGVSFVDRTVEVMDDVIHQSLGKLAASQP